MTNSTEYKGFMDFQNTLFTNDNLFVLYGLNSEIADLIYLDPPFNSKRMYSAPVGSKAAGSSFKDMWTWDDVNEGYLETLSQKYPALTKFISTIGEMHSKPMMAYITYMTQRIIELHRILKSTGSLYLHCDPTASHYLKIVLDEVFGKGNFRNEITWERSHQHNLASKKFDVVTDIIFFYTKSDNFYFTNQYSSISSKEVEEKFPYIEEETGRRFTHEKLEQSSNRKEGDYKRIIQGKVVTVSKGLGWRWTQETFDERLRENPYLIYWTENGKPRYKRYADEYGGRLVTNLWNDVKGLSSNSKERTGYPTQKPLALLERVIKASSKEGDVVLDPFCGCATTCVASEKLGRKWMGIDIEKNAVSVLMKRFDDELGGLITNYIHRTDIPKRTDVEEIEINKNVKERLFKEQEGLCNGCRTEFEIRHFEVDHIVPKAKGGGDYYENYQLLCSSCNRIKGARPMEYLRMKIRAIEEKLRDRFTFGE
jgi:DNA modification methylase